jgi:Flp pilus assembly protein TadD
MLAELYLSQHKLDRALIEFDQLAARESRPVSALTMAGLILQAKGDQRGARQRFEKAVAMDSGAAVAANNLAWMYAESGERLDDAVRLARAAAETLPDSPEVLDTLGWVYFQAGLAAQAVAPLAKCLERDPKNATCRYHLGAVYVKTGEPARARESLTQALALQRNATWAAAARRLLSEIEPGGRR